MKELVIIAMWLVLVVRVLFIVSPDAKRYLSKLGFDLHKFNEWTDILTIISILLIATICTN